MEQKKYIDVIKLTPKQDILNVGDNIVIQEKANGVNASFKLDDEGNIMAFVKDCLCNEGNNGDGFYAWVQSLDPTKLVKDAIYFGEWIAKSKQFYLFDAFDKSIGKYVRWDIAKYEADRIGINFIPVFSVQKYQSYENLLSFVGNEDGEGIVVKCVDKQFFGKILNDKKKQKASKPNKEIVDNKEKINSWDA